MVYTKDNKTAAVGAPRPMLHEHTAVSGEVAQEMAKGGLARCPADVVVAITGVAGPEPDEDGNPVGLVYVAVATRGDQTTAERHEFGKRGKVEICTAAMGTALAPARGCGTTSSTKTRASSAVLAPRRAT